MLILTLSRQRDTTVCLTLPTGEVVRIHLLDMRGRQVQLGVEAPQSVRIARERKLSEKEDERDES